MPGERTEPAIAVVVPSHERPLRLRWLLNALEEQTLDRELFEVIVCHDSRGRETERLLRSHPLAAVGVLRAIAVAPGNGPAPKRNAAWRAARAPLVAFTDDDCRPPADWLELLLQAAVANPRAIVQGRTEPDPDEQGLLHACAHAHTQEIEPPAPWGQTCNIVYPRVLLEQVGGFDERLDWAEDADLAWRAREAGAALVGAPEVLSYHAVQPQSLPAALTAGWRTRELPRVVARHPGLRRAGGFAGLFWKRRHAYLLLALSGGALAARGRGRRGGVLAAVLSLPWLVSAAPAYGPSLRGRARTLSELPSRAAIDIVELSALAAGSVRSRTLFL